MKKRIRGTSFMLIFFLGVCFAGFARGENLVQNGNFEDGNTGWTEWNSPQGWVNGTFEHDYASGSDVWIPDPYPYAGGHTHSQRKGVANIHGGLYQVINVMQGKKYTITGQWSGGIGGLVPNSNTAAGWYEVVIYDGIANPDRIDAAPGPDDVTIAKITHAGTSVFSFGWQTYSGSFTARSNQVTLALKTGKVGDWDAIAAYHDDILIYDYSWSKFMPATTGMGVR